MEDIDSKLYAKMVEKVGSRLYWERWARDLAPFAQNIIGRIAELTAPPGDLQDSFRQFTEALRAAINDSVTEQRAMEMLGQHLITSPVFSALFADYAFAGENPVSRAMKNMADKLNERGFARDTARLADFYQSVRQNLGEVKTLAGKQTVIKNLYDSFFKGAFPLAVEQLGIVYTPVECVDFILHSVDGVLRQEFGAGLTDEGVHVLDPFTGTGTFITRLLQSGLIRPEDLQRKYLHEIHCNELVLLAYYVAAVNIEAVYHDLARPEQYQPFDGICLTDTFELGRTACQPDLFPMLRENLEYMAKQQKAPIRVIIGNPPYSAGQRSGNDNARNLKYPLLDKRIEETYVAKSTAVLKNSLYDSYIRAFRWATDRLKKDNQGGVIGFVTNSKWLDGNASSGFRKCLEEEFTSIYIFDLKGAVRAKSTEQARKEGGNVFDILTGVCMVILVYNPAKAIQKAQIRYCDIGDYLSREKKLAILAERKSIFSKKMAWSDIQPDEYGDWLKQRSDLFGNYIILGDKKDKDNKETFFEPCYSNGVSTSRDAWCWNFSKISLENNISHTIQFYNEQCGIVQGGGQISFNPQHFSWSRSTEAAVSQNKLFDKLSGKFLIGEYRAFTKSNLYFSRQLNEIMGQMPLLFPTSSVDNKIICITGAGSRKEFSCIMLDRICERDLLEKSQCFPLYHYRQKANQQGDLFGANKGRYERRDGITDWILRNVRGRFGNARTITKETIFYYVYGLLHSPDYRARFADDLKKSLPRLPVIEPVEKFMAFAEAGRELADLHLNYADAQPCPEVIVTGAESGDFQVERMKFAGKMGAWDKSRIIYNSHIQISNIPLRAYDYVVNGRSAVEWIMESYRIKRDRDSGILNDPNQWAWEHARPRYILDLLLAVIGLSLQTLKIVESLPKCEFPGEGEE